MRQGAEPLEVMKRRPGHVASQLVIRTMMECRQAIQVVHYVKGRIWFKVDATLLKRCAHGDWSEFQPFMQTLTSLEGVCNIQARWSASSVVISYDPQRIAPHRWHTLLTGDEEEVRAAIDALGLPTKVLD